MRCFFPALLSLATPALSDPPVIDAVDLQRGDTGWTVSVTLSHPDTGWDHYADNWRIETADGTILGTRLLLHPHVEEQPFTRSLSDVQIPETVTEIYLRAGCIRDGWNEDAVRVALP